MKRLIIIASVCVISHIGFAQNKNIIRTGEKTFSVGLYTAPFRFEKLNYSGNIVQNALFGDWATCLVMALNYNGLNVSQEQVMSLVNGSIEEPLGTPQDLMFAINKNTPAAWGKKSKVYCAIATLNPDVLFDELSANRPVIIGLGGVGTEGRAVVITAMSYQINTDAAGNQTGITPVSVTFRDPWPSGSGNLTVTWNSMVNLTASLYTINVEFKQ